jgi:putative ABC transport system permease protein
VAPFRRFLHRIVTLFRRSRAESDLAREIAAHLQLLEDTFIQEGMTRQNARYAARRAFGGIEQVKERQRDERSFRWLTGWPMDLKLGARMLVKSPGLTAIAIVALAVAIGAGAAYLEFTRDLMWPTLHVADADRIVGIRVWDPERRAAQVRAQHDFALWRRNIGTLEQFGAAREFERHLITPDGRTETVRGAEISASAFRIVPSAAILGRTLIEDDERPGAEPAAVIGHDLWQARFDADPNVVGGTVRLGSTVHTIVGVMPEGFAFPVNQSLWTPLKVQAAPVKRGEGPAIMMFGKLKDGLSPDAAQAELQGLLNADSTPLADGRPNAGAALRADVRPYLDSLLADDRGSVEVAIARAANLVFMMLLGICGANVATLVFARTAMREAEITVRTALGATRGRISAQLFAEALVLSCAGAVAGLAIAHFVGLWGKQMWIEGAGEPRPFWWDDALHPETVLYAAVLAVFAALIIGVVPALKATGPQLQGRLREAGAAGSTMKFGRLWTGVVVTQAAVTVIFLATVVSLGWTALRGQYSFDVTYARDRFLTAQVVPDAPSAGARGPRHVTAEALQAIVARLRTEPGVVNATYATAVPGTTWEQFVMEFATPEVAAGATHVTEALWSEGARVGPGFFETLGIPLVAGRFFTDAEILGAHNVAIVDETFVRTILDGRSPLGLMVREAPSGAGGNPGPWHEIVGVVKDVTILTRKGPDDAVLYRPAGTGAAAPMRLLVRTQGAASSMAHALQSAAVSVNAAVRLADVMSMDRLAADEALPMRFFLRVFAVIAAIALLLSTAGIYALISFTLARRTREIGIRVALGAAPGRIITGVFSRAFVQIGTGVLAGALPSLMVLRDGVDDTGQMGTALGMAVTLAVCAFVLLIALISCAAPLRKALRIEPTQALRADA